MSKTVNANISQVLPYIIVLMKILSVLEKWECHSVIILNLYKIFK